MRKILSNKYHYDNHINFIMWLFSDSNSISDAFVYNNYKNKKGIKND